MATINMVPKFTTDDGKEEVKQAVDETTEEGKEPPTEPPAVEKPAGQPEQDSGASTELEKAKLGLQTEIERLRAQVVELRGQRREIKKEELIVATQKMDDLADVNPEDAKLIDRVLRSKGYVTKEESSKMYYKSVQDEELNRFLEKYPEYKPQNDPADTHWTALQAELALYKMPENPHKVQEILERAHRSIARGSTDHEIPAKKKAIETASVGAGGSQRSSSSKSLSPESRSRYEAGGWSEEEIRKIEAKL